MATLFSYFTKSPKIASTPGKDTNTSPKEQAKGVAEKGGISTPPGRMKLPNSFVVQRHDVGEVVWAKMDGHPWWPSMICKHPSSGRYEKKSGKFIDIHVQFFGEPPTRGWVRKRDIQGINSRKVEQDDDIAIAYKQAKDALKLKPEERIEKYYACATSDEEMEDEDVECEEAEQDKDADGLVISQSKDNGENGSSDKAIDLDDDNDDDNELSLAKRANRKRTRVASQKLQRKKMKTVIDSDSDSGDEYKPNGNDESSDESVSSGVDEAELEEDEEIDEDEEVEEIDAKKKSKPKKGNHTPLRNGDSTKKPSSFTTPVNKTSPSALMERMSNSMNKAQMSLKKFSAEPSSPTSDLNVGEERTFDHEKWNFLKDGCRKDKYGRLHTDPDYDGRTLLIPESFMKSKEVTPALRQWWELKRDFFDTILFFKMGKFYELYHTDAVVGVRELGILFMRGKAAHCGFPEIAYSRYSDILVQRGYKVARIEQTETPQMMAERCAKKTGAPKVVRRELVAVTSKGTKTFGFMEGQAVDAESSFLLAFCERNNGETGSTFGVCFLDTSIGKFHIGQFEDDRQSSRFRTLISHYPPVEVLYERNNLSSKTQSILQHELLATLKEPLIPGTEFWESGKTLKELVENNWFDDSSTKSDDKSIKSWPPVIRKMLSDADTLGLTASDEYSLAISALGACIWHLKKCLIEEELLSMCQFEEYIPVDNLQKLEGRCAFPEKRQKNDS